MKIRVGDNVVVNTGKDRGKTGLVAKIYINQDKVLVEGVNAKTKHVKGRDGVPGERAEIFVPIHISNVSVVDAKTGKGSRIGYLVDEKGAKTRITKASGQVVAKASTKKSTEAKSASPIIKEKKLRMGSKKEVKKIKA